MLLTLEALAAKHGDALLLHWGDPAAPRLAVIDGGPSGVYSRTLRRRLEAIRDARCPGDELPIDLMVVSHIDDDHVRGLLDLTAKLVEAEEEQRPLPWRPRELWHNAFDDLVGAGADQLFSAAVAEVGGAAALAGPPAGLPIHRSSALVLASVPQGRRLRDDARRLGIPVNPGSLPEDCGLLAAPRSDPFDLGHGATARLVAPSRARVVALREEWDRELERRNLGVQPQEASAAAYLDGSVYNLASLVLLVEADGARMLLTGDARGDDILSGLREAGQLVDGRCHVDLLKLPHHGSDRNVETDFFRAVTADHYVVSGDGRHGNPEPATFHMLLCARPDDDFTIHLTYGPDDLRDDAPADELRRVLECHRQAGHRFSLVARESEAKSLRVDLLEPYAGP